MEGSAWSESNPIADRGAPVPSRGVLYLFRAVKWLAHFLSQTFYSEDVMSMLGIGDPTGASR